MPCPTMDRNIEPALGRIDSRCRRASLRHPRRPRLV